MTSKSLVRVVPACIFCILLGASHPGGRTQAATGIYWNAGGTGGSGIWGSTPGDKNWNPVAGAALGNTFWQDGPDDVAMFQDGIGGIVTVFDSVRTAGISQSGGDYTIEAGTILLAAGAVAVVPVIEVEIGTLTMVTPLLGSEGMVKSGNGTLRLVAANPLSGAVDIASGLLELEGSLPGSGKITIAVGAALQNQNGGLATTADVSNAGTLTLGADQTLANYESHGGMLAAGAGSLSVASALLKDGSVIEGRLNAGAVTSHGAVAVSGVLATDTLHVAGGILTNSGSIGSPAAWLDLGNGSTLVAGGMQNFALLTTSGGGGATWTGDLTNAATVAPGGVGTAGLLQVSGEFSNLPSGLLQMDLAAGGSDLIWVTESAILGGTLELSQGPGAAIAAFVPVQIIAAAAFAGNFSSISESIDGGVFFNPGNGTVTRLGTGAASAPFLDRVSQNQAAAWVSLYEDVIDPGVQNVTGGPAGIAPYQISSGIAAVGNPDLLWALAGSFSAAGLDAGLLNRLSPEVYGGFSDFATQATRSHQRAAIQAPALGPVAGVVEAGGAKGGTKAVLPAVAMRGMEFFAALSSFHAETDGSLSGGDYALDGMGVIGGVRIFPTERLMVAGYVAGSDGTVEGALIDADADGWSLGVVGEWLLEAEGRARVTGAISYGDYRFDGNRGSATATAAGWVPGQAGFSGVRQDALELYVGFNSVFYEDAARGLRLIPSAGLRYGSGSMDDFKEDRGPIPGAPIALHVVGTRYQTLLAEAALLAEYDLSERLTLRGQLGMNLPLAGDDRVLRASFAGGSRAMRVHSEGLSDELLFLSLGGEYRLNDTTSIGLGYRGEFRGEDDAQHGFSLLSSFRF